MNTAVESVAPEAKQKKATLFRVPLFKRTPKDTSNYTKIQLTHLDQPASIGRDYTAPGKDNSKLKMGPPPDKKRGLNVYVPWKLKLGSKADQKNTTPTIDKAESTSTLPRNADPTIPPSTTAEPFKSKKLSLKEFHDQFKFLVTQQVDADHKENQKWDGSFHTEPYSQEYKSLNKRAQKSLLQKDIDLERWLVYVEIQDDSNDSKGVNLMPPLFHEILVHLSHNSKAMKDKQGYVDTDLTTCAEKFWESTEQLIENLTDVWILKCFKNGKSEDTDESDILRMLGTFSEYFARRVGVLGESEAKAQTKFMFSNSKIETAISKQAQEMFNARIGTPTLESVIQGTKKLTQDLYRDESYLKNLFKPYRLNLNAYDTVYSMWDYQLSECVKIVLKEECISKELKPVEFQNGNPVISENFDSKIVDSLFALYKELRNFALLTDKPALPNFVQVKGSFHNWFQPFVAQWLDTVYLKTVTWINKAIQTDSFEPTSRHSKISESAVHTVDIFIGMKASWCELNWPNVEEAYTFAVLMLDIFSLCMQHYVDHVYKRSRELEFDKFEKFEISDEFCIAFNNVAHVQRMLTSTLDKLCIEQILTKLSTELSPNSTALEQCRSTPPNLIENLTEKVHQKMRDSLVISCAKVDPMLQTLFTQLTLAPDENEAEIRSGRIVTHLSSVLTHLKANLTETEFDKAFPTISQSVFNSFRDFVQHSLNETYKEIFYQNLTLMLSKLRNLFIRNDMTDNDGPDNVEIEELTELLKLNGSSTRELKLEYLQEQAKALEALGISGPCGTLTVKADYFPNVEILRIEILNASLTHKKAGEANSYVRFQIYTRSGEEYPVKHETKVIKGNHALFEQEFQIKLGNAEHLSGGFIHFWLRQGLRREFLGESFLPLEKVPRVDHTRSSLDIPQNKLPLVRPKTSKLLNILERRKSASAFVQSQKSRFE